MLITLVNVDSKMCDDLKNLGCNIVRNARDTGLDVQMDTSIFTIRVSDGYIRLRNKEIRKTFLIYDNEFRSIDVR